MDGEDGPLPEGWTKHWSNSWKKHYWFNSKTGNQSWEPPPAPARAESKRPAPEPAQEAANKAARTESPAAVPSSQPAQAPAPASDAAPAKKPAVAASPAKNSSSSAGGLLGSILGSIEKEGSTVDRAKIAEDRRRRKEVEDTRKIEEKASRDNYRMFVLATLDAFATDERDVHEFPPTDNLHRLIVQDEAESRGMPAISQGSDGVDRRAFVFKPDKAPNERELRFLTVGEGTVGELLRRRETGDQFMEYNNIFSLNDAKIVTKTKTSNKNQTMDHDDEVEARVVQNRAGDAGAVADAAAKIQQRRKEAGH